MIDVNNDNLAKESNMFIRPKKIKNKKYIFILLSLIVIAVFILDSMYYYSLSCRRVNTRHALYVARESIKWYKAQTGTYPLHLRTIKEYVEEDRIGMDSHSTILFNPDLHKECITSASGNSMEYIELNGHGGFYYNFNTGEVKLNVIKPLKEYLWLYFLAKNGNEIPSDW